MSIDELSLLVRSIYREFVQNPSKISRGNDMVFFRPDMKVHENKVVIFHACSLRALWCTIDGEDYECSRPSFFRFKKCKHFDVVLRLFKEILEQDGIKVESIEEKILKIVPAAKDIVAERALVGDQDE